MSFEDEYSYPPGEDDARPEGPREERGIMNAPRPGAFLAKHGEADAFLARVAGMSEAQARALFRAETRMHRWNAATQWLILKGIRSHG